MLLLVKVVHPSHHHHFQYYEMNDFLPSVFFFLLMLNIWIFRYHNDQCHHHLLIPLLVVQLLSFYFYLKSDLYSCNFRGFFRIFYKNFFFLFIEEIRESCRFCTLKFRNFVLVRKILQKKNLVKKKP